MEEFGVNAIFGMMTGQAIVEVSWLGQKVQVSPGDARTMAHLLLECAEAAESDACVVHVLTGMGMKRDDVARLLLAMREKRAELESEQDGS